MKAVRVHEYGDADVLKYEDAPRPTIGEGEVLIRVHAAAVNPMDWKVRAGYLKEFFRYKLPMVPGWDVSGVVEATAPGITRLQRGDEVYARPDVTRDGAYAEYIAVKEAEVALKPKSVDHVRAAAIPLAALTAWQALFEGAGLEAGQRILIHGAAGGVGSFAVQLAKWKGAYVIGIASARNQDFLRTLGADETIDYEKTRFEEVVRNVDVVVDTIGGDARDRLWQTLKKGGILVSVIGQASADEAAKHGVRHASVVVQPKLEQLAEIARLVDAGTVKPIVETVLPLSEAKRAHELNQTGHTRGKIVLRVV